MSHIRERWPPSRWDDLCIISRILERCKNWLENPLTFSFIGGRSPRPPPMDPPLHAPPHCGGTTAFLISWDCPTTPTRFDLSDQIRLCTLPISKGRGPSPQLFATSYIHPLNMTHTHTVTKFWVVIKNDQIRWEKNFILQDRPRFDLERPNLAR